MRKWLALLALLAAACVAAEDRATTVREDNENERALEMRLDEAQRRLEEAAEEVARLSQQISGEAMQSLRFVMGKRAMLGINLGPADTKGIAVAGVTPGGPADKAGLAAGDLLLEIDGHSLATDKDAPAERKLHEYLDKVEPGTKVSLRYRREGKAREATLETVAMEGLPHMLGRMVHPLVGDMGDFDFPLPPVAFGGFGHWGDMELVELTPGLGAYFGAKEGLLVVRAAEDNPFGLKDGDVIRAIGGRKPQDARHAMRILRSYAAGEQFTLEVLRNKRAESLKVLMPERSLPPHHPPLPPHPPVAPGLDT